MAGNCNKCRKALDESDPGECWGRHPFCFECIRAAGLGEFIGAVPVLEETVEFGFGESLWRRIRSRFWIGTGITGVVFGMYLCLHLTHGGRFPPLFFFKFCLLFVPLLSIPTAVAAAYHSPRQRKIWVEDGKLIEHTVGWITTGSLGARTTALALKPSSWAAVRFALEQPGEVWMQPLIQVFGSAARNPRECGTTPILCGYSGPFRRLWSGYFALRGVRRIADPFPGYCVMMGPPIGGMVGMSIALFVDSLTGDAAWVVPLGVLGYADGLLGGIARATALATNSARLRKWFRSHPFLSAVVVIGLTVFCGRQVGTLGGAVQAAGCAVINIVFGLILWFSLLVAASSDGQTNHCSES